MWSLFKNMLFSFTANIMGNQVSISFTHLKIGQIMHGVCLAYSLMHGHIFTTQGHKIITRNLKFILFLSCGKCTSINKYNTLGVLDWLSWAAILTAIMCVCVCVREREREREQYTIPREQVQANKIRFNNGTNQIHHM